MTLAPVVLFVYNRPWHTHQTLDALSINIYAHQTVLYVYADGAKPNASLEDKNLISRTRNEISKYIDSFKEVRLIKRSSNFGLASNLIDGITNVLKHHDSVIVLEDDLVTIPYFLQYCNEGLQKYKNEQNVFSINGYQFPLGLDEHEVFLSPLATSSWGWATWKDRWDQFLEVDEHDQHLLNSHTFLNNRFNFASYQYSALLNSKNSWAIRWYYTAFMHNGLGVFPTRSLIINNGFDGSGVHCEEQNVPVQMMATDKINVIKHKRINLKYEAALLDYFYENLSTPSVLDKSKETRYVRKGFFSKLILKVFGRLKN